MKPVGASQRASQQIQPSEMDGQHDNTQTIPHHLSAAPCLAAHDRKRLHGRAAADALPAAADALYK